MKIRFLYLVSSLIILAAILLSKSFAHKRISDEYIYNIESVSASNYIIKEYNGYVAVYKIGSDSPVQILDCKINSLPPDAAEALATGIEVSGEDELQKIIEAYD